MGSYANGVGRTYPNFNQINPLRVRFVPLKHMISRDLGRILTDSNRTFTGFSWNPVKNCLAPLSADPIYPVPT